MVGLPKSHLPTKFSKTDDFPADWPPTTAICGRSMTMGTPSCVKASCIRLMIGMRASMPWLPWPAMVLVVLMPLATLFRVLFLYPFVTVVWLLRLSFAVNSSLYQYLLSVVLSLLLTLPSSSSVLNCLPPPPATPAGCNSVQLGADLNPARAHTTRDTATGERRKDQRERTRGKAPLSKANNKGLVKEGPRST